jgi:hypothetical protein
MTDEETKDTETALEVVQPAGVLRPAADAVDAFKAYKELQMELDNVLEDCTVKIQGRLHRKKSYWRAVATSFGLSVDLISEAEMKNPADETDWGYAVTYVARAKNGQYAVGDGACFASEKQRDNQKTVHNVRSHAHTRGFNRAVSNLVGFGEVSAEEIIKEGAVDNTQPNKSKGAAKAGGPMTDPQRLKIMASLTNIVGKDNDKRKEFFLEVCGNLGFDHIHSTKQLSKTEASAVIEELEKVGA